MSDLQKFLKMAFANIEKNVSFCLIEHITNNDFDAIKNMISVLKNSINKNVYTNKYFIDFLVSKVGYFPTSKYKKLFNLISLEDFPFFISEIIKKVNCSLSYSSNIFIEDEAKLTIYFLVSQVEPKIISSYCDQYGDNFILQTLQNLFFHPESLFFSDLIYMFFQHGVSLNFKNTINNKNNYPYDNLIQKLTQEGMNELIMIIYDEIGDNMFKELMPNYIPFMKKNMMNFGYFCQSEYEKETIDKGILRWKELNNFFRTIY